MTKCFHEIPSKHTAAPALLLALTQAPLVALEIQVDINTEPSPCDPTATHSVLTLIIPT